jgi:SpoVK/Ycf46/Vps4 family AAA+-type ATPase
MLISKGPPRIIKLYGDAGCCKTNIAMKAINYCMNRNLIENGAYQINAESSYNIESFLNKIFQVFRLNATDIADIDDLLDTL